MALYTANVHVTGGRAAGHAKSADGTLDLQLALPKELGGAGGAANPELLFAAGYGACFDGALNLMARKADIKLDGTEIDVAVSLDPHEETFQLSVMMDVTIKGIDQATADDLVAKAHAGCPYSKAIRNNVDVSFNVKTA